MNAIGFQLFITRENVIFVLLISCPVFLSRLMVAR